jgi:hypothetical protein
LDLWTFLGSAAAKDISATVILAGVVIAIFTGVLVPGRTVKRELADKDKVIAGLERTGITKDELIARLTEQNGLLIKGGRITDAFFKDVLPARPETSGDD